MKDSQSVTEQKNSLRRQIRRQAAAYYPLHRSACSAALLSQLQKLPEFSFPGTFFCYVGTDLEPDTLPLLRLLLEKEKSVAVPLCTGPGQMEARRIPSLEALRTGRWGIMEPRENSLLIDPSSIAFALVPCLCCDLQGRRLGHGGGYYDRFLSNATFPWAVFCPEALLADQIPVESFDLPTPILITENRILRFGDLSNQ